MFSQIDVRQTKVFQVGSLRRRESTNKAEDLDGITFEYFFDVAVDRHDKRLPAIASPLSRREMLVFRPLS